MICPPHWFSNWNACRYWVETVPRLSLSMCLFVSLTCLRVTCSWGMAQGWMSFPRFPLTVAPLKLHEWKGHPHTHSDPKVLVTRHVNSFRPHVKWDTFLRSHGIVWRRVLRNVLASGPNGNVPLKMNFLHNTQVSMPRSKRIDRKRKKLVWASAFPWTHLTEDWDFQTEI